MGFKRKNAGLIISLLILLTTSICHAGFETEKLDIISSSTPSVSDTNSSRIYYNGATDDTLKLSVDGGPYYDIATSSTVPNYESDPLSLHLDQTTPQTIINGVPLMTTAVNEYGSGNQLVNKDYCDSSWLLPPIIEWYDPTGGLPVDPEVGDRYGSDATANGWTIDYIYEWTGEEWMETEPEEGFMLWDLLDYILWEFMSGMWLETESSSYWSVDTAQTGLTGSKTLTDNTFISFGTGGDSQLYYDGTNLIINPKVVGSGYLSILGDVNATGTGTFGGATDVVQLKITGNTSQTANIMEVYKGTSLAAYFDYLGNWITKMGGVQIAYYDPDDIITNHSNFVGYIQLLGGGMFSPIIGTMGGGVGGIVDLGDILTLQTNEFANAGTIDCVDNAVTTIGALGAGVGTLSGNNANAAFTLLNLNNTDTPSTTETAQTSDLVFNLTQSINSVVSLHEAAKISAYKVSDWFHASAETDTDSGLKFWTTNSGTPTLQLTIDEVGLATFAGAVKATSTFIFEKGTYDLTLASEAITSSAKTITFPNVTGTVPLGTGVGEQIALWSATNTLIGSAEFTFTEGDLYLTNGMFANYIEVAGTGTFAGLVLNGKATTYNSVATVSNGIPSELATVDLTAQTAAIGTTTLYAVPATGAGMYRISYTAKVTTAASTSSTLGVLTVGYTDADATTPTIVGATNTGNTTTSLVQDTVIVYAKASTNITYAMGYITSGATPMAYNLHIKCEAL